MRMFRSMRLMVLAFFLCLIPASSFAGVFISVGFAPPALPVYEQPICPEPGLMWVPGYWAYGPDGYYWVPGAWVDAPYTGALWTPGYWGFETNFYVWHPGYWGNRVGYYGGVNYGFGYMGVGFAGGYWRGGAFTYNTAVMRVDRTRVVNVYEDRRIVERNTIVRDSRVSFNGGRGGIRYNASAAERATFNDRRIGATTYQAQFENSARTDHNAYASRNNGRPSNYAIAHPMPVQQQHQVNQGQWQRQQNAPTQQNQNQQQWQRQQNQQLQQQQRQENQNQQQWQRQQNQQRQEQQRQLNQNQQQWQRQQMPSQPQPNLQRQQPQSQSGPVAQPQQHPESQQRQVPSERPAPQQHQAPPARSEEHPHGH